MFTIYALTNKVTGEQYVGVTGKSIEQRMKWHRKEAMRDRAKHRKLYVSINQYGLENFEVVLLDHCDDKEQAFELERQYIKELDSVEFGLNESLGGTGKSFVEHDVIAECYKDLGTARKVAQKLGCGTDTVRACLLYTSPSPRDS